MGLRLLQSNFNRGEISPELLLRDDNENFAAACSKALNVLSIPQGGLGRFPGLQYFAPLHGKARLEPFEFNTTQVYVVAFSDLLAEVFANGSLVASLTAPWTAAEIFDLAHPMVCDQQADTMLCTHGAHTPMKLFRHVGTSGPLVTDALRYTSGSNRVVVYAPNHNVVAGQTVTIAGAADLPGITAADINNPAGHVVLSVQDKDNFRIVASTSASSSGAGGGAAMTYSSADFWTIERLVADLTEGGETSVSAADLAFTLAPETRIINVPLFNFEDSLTPIRTDEIQQIQFAGPWYTDAVYRLYFGDYLTPKLKFATDADTNMDTIQTALLASPQAVAAGAGPQDIVLSVDVSAPPVGDPARHKGPFNITFTGKMGNHNWADIQPKVVSNDQGGTIAVDPNARPGTSGLEPSWSVNRGWPRTVCFHEQRTAFGGSPSLPTSVWLSKTGEFFDFDLGQETDDQGIAYVGGADRLDAIVAVVSLRKFVILTSGSEFYSNESPTTPRNFREQRDTARGAAPIQPMTLDGSVLFVQRDRTAIRQMLYHDVEQAYTVEDLSILARALLKAPVDMDILQGSVGDFLHVVNGDGTLAVLNTNRTQGVSAWTRRETREGDRFISVCAIHDPLSNQSQRMWACVERSINGQTLYYLERLTDGVYLDCALRRGAGADTVTGLGHLEGESVLVRLDNGRSFLTRTVAGGAIDLTGETWDAVDVGFNTCLPDVETVPVTFDLPSGRAALSKKRISGALIDVLNTVDVWAGRTGGQLQRFDRVDFEEFGAAPTPVSGPLRRRALGWERRPTFRITQQNPGPWFVRGVELEVEVRG